MNRYTARDEQGRTITVTGTFLPDGSGLVVLGTEERTHVLSVTQARKLVIGLLLAIDTATGDAS